MKHLLLTVGLVVALSAVAQPSPSSSAANVASSVALSASAALAPASMPAPAQHVTLVCPAAVTTAAPAKPCELEGLFGGIAWPLVALVGLVVVTFNRNLRRGLTRLLRRVNKVKGGPLELEFSAEAAQDVKASIGDDLRDYKLAAASEYDRQARAQDLDKLLRLAVVDVKRAIPSIASHDVRVTIHVPDVVFSGCLYQLLDYQSERTGRGRRWSERFGIIGRAWRMDRSVYTSHALGNSQQLPKEQAIQELLRSWGMNQPEAEQAAKGSRQSFVCIILRVHQRQVGVLYLDAAARDVFKDAAANPSDIDSLDAKVELEQLPAVVQLAQAVDKALGELRGGGTYLDF